MSCSIVLSMSSNKYKLRVICGNQSPVYSARGDEERKVVDDTDCNPPPLPQQSLPLPPLPPALPLPPLVPGRLRGTYHEDISQQVIRVQLEYNNLIHSEIFAYYPLRDASGERTKAYAWLVSMNAELRCYKNSYRVWSYGDNMKPSGLVQMELGDGITCKFDLDLFDAIRRYEWTYAVTSGHTRAVTYQGLSMHQLLYHYLYHLRDVEPPTCCDDICHKPFCNNGDTLDYRLINITNSLHSFKSTGWSSSPSLALLPPQRQPAPPPNSANACFDVTTTTQSTMQT